jgi:pimeloyl-ACP methyl ester carboxylesterase
MVPTLIVAGARDVVPLAAIRDFAERLHGSRLVVFEDCGHFPFVEDEARFARTVRGFLEEFDERRLQRGEGNPSGRGD